VSGSSRVQEAANEFENWRRAQELERKARPVSLFDEPAAIPVESPPTEAAAIKSVAANAGSAWMRHASSAIRAAAHRSSTITVDDVHPFLTEQPHDLRALGAAMRQAARDGFIERIPGEYRTSERPETHSRPLAVWRSRIFEAVA